jgi:hypothetical protein
MTPIQQKEQLEKAIKIMSERLDGISCSDPVIRPKPEPVDTANASNAASVNLNQ